MKISVQEYRSLISKPSKEKAPRKKRAESVKHKRGRFVNPEDSREVNYYE